MTTKLAAHVTRLPSAATPARASQPSTLISIPAFAREAQVGQSTLWRWLAEDPEAPRPLRLSARCTRLDRAEALAWLRKKGGQE